MAAWRFNGWTASALSWNRLTPLSRSSPSLASGWPSKSAEARLRAQEHRPRCVGEPRRRSEREHATLSLGRAAAELAERDAHVPAENVCAGVGLDDDHLMPVRMPGRRQQADSR